MSSDELAAAIGTLSTAIVAGDKALLALSQNLVNTVLMLDDKINRQQEQIDVLIAESTDLGNKYYKLSDKLEDYIRENDEE